MPSLLDSFSIFNKLLGWTHRFVNFGPYEGGYKGAKNEKYSFKFIS
jgi:hypothetical protein